MENLEKMCSAGESGRSAEEVAQDIIEYLRENEDVLITAIEDLDCWNGYLDNGRYYDMDMLNEVYQGCEPIELLSRAYFGWDEDSWHMNGSSKEYNAFNPNRAYFTYNGYGNLVSTDYKDYSAYLDMYLMDELCNNRSHIDVIDDDETLSKLFDEFEESEM